MLLFIRADMIVSAKVYVRGNRKGFEEVVNHFTCSNDRQDIKNEVTVIYILDDI